MVNMSQCKSFVMYFSLIHMTIQVLF